MFRDATIPRWATGALVLVALFAGSCGSGAVDGPDDDTAQDEAGGDDGGGDDDGTDGDGSGGDDGGGSGGESAGGGGGGGGDRYSWGLPGGELDPDGSVNVYNALVNGCAAGRTALESTENELEREKKDPSTQSETSTFWPPERVALYHAAIATCENDLAAAGQYLLEAGLTESRGDCTIYQRIRSVLEQRAPETVECPAPSSSAETSSTTTSTTTTTLEDGTTSSSETGDTTSTDTSVPAGEGGEGGPPSDAGGGDDGT